MSSLTTWISGKMGIQASRNNYQKILLETEHTHKFIWVLINKGHDNSFQETEKIFGRIFLNYCNKSRVCLPLQWICLYPAPEVCRSHEIHRKPGLKSCTASQHSQSFCRWQLSLDTCMNPKHQQWNTGKLTLPEDMKTFLHIKIAFKSRLDH